MPIEPGTVLGAYEVHELLGQGAMGTVYRAYHTGLARTAAVKVLQALAPDPDAAARFRREAQAIAQLRHPNVLNVYDFGDHEGTPYMVVEYMPGGSLSDRLKAGERFDRTTSLRFLDGIASGLDYAHGMGIIHRDVKPANVLLDRNGNPVLGDFGLAKLLQRASVKTVSGVTTGTPAYMSPEQVMGATVGPPADTYALTTMAYEFLAGSVPFEGEGMLELLYAHVHREPPAASSRNPELSPAVDAVLARGLAKDPAARWDSGAALVGALAEALAPARQVEATMPIPTPARAAPDYVFPRAAPQRPPRRLLLAAVAGALLVALLLGVLAVAARPHPSVTLSASTVAPGASLTADFSGFRAGQSLDVYLGTNAAKLATVRTDSQGAAAYDFSVPRLLTPGQHALRGCVGTVCVQSSFTVRRAG